MLDVKDEITQDAIEYIRSLFEGNSGGHDFDHSMRVYRNAKKLLESHPEADYFAVCLAALLHDADDHKLFDTKGNLNSRTFLERKGVDPETIDRICDVINSVSFSQNRGRKPQSIEGMIVQDADRLDAMGALGIARTFAYGGEHGRSLQDSVDHFHDKLLLLKDELNLDESKQIAEKRHDFMLQFLSELEDEID